MQFFVEVTYLLPLDLGSSQNGRRAHKRRSGESKRKGPKVQEKAVQGRATQGVGHSGSILFQMSKKKKRHLRTGGVVGQTSHFPCMQMIQVQSLVSHIVP